ncbi:hypothetical protein AAVH_23926 [Aphelenchoides avenae]|nr:hypothetical protein AAVH_23926 [Aphelenchus avenae]
MKEVNGSTNQTQEIILVNFDKPIKLEPGKDYTASVAVSGLPTSYGDRGASTKTVATKKGNVVFSFKQSTMPAARSCAREGQIPQILFRV